MKALHLLTNKTALVVLFTVLVGSGAWIVVQENIPREIAAVPNADTAHVAVLDHSDTEPGSAHAVADTDGDGLLDWEETLWGTDPTVADSDGDGTADGAEVEQRRHPARSAPDDELVEQSEMTVSESISAYLADETRTETEKAALRLFQGFSNLRKVDGFGTPAQTALVDELVAGQFATDKRRYSRFDLVTVPANDDARRAYKDEYEAAVSLFEAVSENELTTLGRALASGNPEDIAPLDIAVAAYAGATRQLLTAPVPLDIAPAHLTAVNALAELGASVRNMRATLDDPVRGSVGVQAYFASTEELTVALRDIRLYFATHGLADIES